MKLFGIDIDPANIEGSIVQAVDSYIENAVKAKWPNSTKLKSLNAAIEANVALGRELADLYVLAKFESVAGKGLNNLAAKYPNIAPLIAQIKAQVPALV